ncbi:hypothetical protein GS8_901 [Geobacillus stearothermophilus]|uniref:Uncharacterized protein n=1 Tax=Geobacillus stearothermophilus TaxID=1422 RepID=A0ABQ7HGJ1_GEOSE|nr:hypothetical protein GS8_901 [Geobacillus stearothermophilus]
MKSESVPASSRNGYLVLKEWLYLLDNIYFLSIINDVETESLA